ncbi:MAG: septal ring lytic transglycosylase RlpA family protein [Acidobacteriales bacterium]|nr:septal ring lytic transglycosylase RlpA family protein [Terriglobales bacterium]
MKILKKDAIHLMHLDKIFTYRLPAALPRAVAIVSILFLGLTLGLTGLQARKTRIAASGIAALPAATPTKSLQSAAIPVAAKPAATLAGWHQVGLASWYGTEFQGKETANGEIFDMNDLTCAHRSLPLGTWVKVTNLHTRKWIVVRVNDRGPVPETRIADLSSAAAHMLGMRDRGVSRVRLDVIDDTQAIQIARLNKQRMARLALEEAPAQPGN